jgi:hypothetical protein
MQMKLSSITKWFLLLALVVSDVAGHASAQHAGLLCGRAVNA